MCEIGEGAVRMRYETSEKMLRHRRKSCALCVPARFLGPKISACKIVYVCLLKSCMRFDFRYM